MQTVGRLSGQPRVAIVGYIEDDENLVTMNGWANAEPAWWLNLQAQPDTTVPVLDGSRAVRACAAANEERRRLLARFSDYPGWGARWGRWAIGVAVVVRADAGSC